jgi:VIT1/CCC1 family predicted Fe2+/Mn2+ transporter
MRLFGRVLEPVERLSEILFGLIMALTVTSAVSVATADQMTIRTMLIAALGCNLAWGIIDAGMYLMARLGERGHNAVVAQAIRKAADREQAHHIIAAELPPVFASIFQTAQLEEVRQHISQMPSSGAHPALTRRDWQGAFGVFALVVAATFPVVIPFVVVGDARVALRISNVLAVASLFPCGFLFGRHAGLPPWRTGLVMVVVGAALVAIAIALGG